MHSPWLTAIEIGSIFSELYKEWAWESGRSKFPNEFFDSRNYKSDIFIKYFISEYLKEVLQDSWYEKLDDKFKSEINFLRQIAPHAIITTNSHDYPQLALNVDNSQFFLKSLL